jgi:hypothetical protein
MKLVAWQGKTVRYFGLTPSEWTCFWLLIFFVLFPKGGFKSGSAPITWGYILLALTLGICWPWWLMRGGWRMEWQQWTALASLIPFQIVLLFSLRANGIGAFAPAFQIFIVFVVLPIAFLVIFPSWLDNHPTQTGSIRAQLIFKTLRWLIIIAAIFGVFLFFAKILTGNFLEIPYLTMNSADTADLETSKDNERAGIFKLMSTYGNGNVYGVSTLLLLPIYDYIEKRWWLKAFMRIVLVLTLSRSVWFGLAVLQFLYLIRDAAAALKRFPRIHIRRAIRTLALPLAVAVLLVFAVIILSSHVGQIFDTNLGGRAQQLIAFNNPYWLPRRHILGYWEIVWAATLWFFGITGFAAFSVIFFTPMLLISSKKLSSSRLGVAAWFSLVLYPLVAWLDGALLLIPVMAFYWFAYMIFLHGHALEPHPEPSRDPNLEYA